MAPSTETGIERTLGRLEGKLEAVEAILKQMQHRGAEQETKTHELVSRVLAIEEHAERMSEVAQHVTSLRQLVRDGKMQGRGIILGLGLASGTAGAALVTLAKQIMSIGQGG